MFPVTGSTSAVGRGEAPAASPSSTAVLVDAADYDFATCSGGVNDNSLEGCVGLDVYSAGDSVTVLLKDDPVGGPARSLVSEWLMVACSEPFLLTCHSTLLVDIATL